MRVLVTGASGCIGAWVTKALLDRGLDVLAYDLTSDLTRLSMIAPAEQVRRVSMEAGTIEDTARVKALVRDGGVTHIVHLAARLMPYCQADPVAGALANVIGTLNVFQAARDGGHPVRIAYASSSAVWGPDDAYPPGKLGEDQPLQPTTHYGVFKQANEGNARIFYAASGISSVGLRPWTVYGVGRDAGLTADPTLAIKALSAGQPFQMRLTGLMDLQYAADVAETFVRCALSPLEGAHAFNLAGDIIDMHDYIVLLDRIRPGAAQLITAAGPQVPVACRLDDSRLRAQVPGIPKTPLEVGIRHTLETYEGLLGAE